MIEIYTDGSGKGGWGAVILYSDGHNEEIGGRISNPTNNRAEMMAIIKSLEYLRNPTEKIRIYSDSAYVVNCFQQKWYKKWEHNGWKTSTGSDVKNRDLWIILIDLIAHYKCEIVKVAGHSNITYNIRADAIATEYNP
jgi:ribonuclease HI